MNISCGDRAALTGRAAQMLTSAGLRILDKDWHPGEHRLAFAAVSRRSVIVPAGIRIPVPGHIRRDFTGIGGGRVRQLPGPAVAWIREHGMLHERPEQIRVGVTGFAPDGCGGHHAEHVGEAG